MQKLNSLAFALTILLVSAFQSLKVLTDISGAHLRLKIDIGREEKIPTTLPDSWARDSRLLLSSYEVCLAERLDQKVSIHKEKNQPLEIIGSPPRYIDVKGEHDLGLDQGTWEILHHDDEPCGRLLIGFNCAVGASKVVPYLFFKSNSIILSLSFFDRTMPVYPPGTYISSSHYGNQKNYNSLRFLVRRHRKKHKSSLK